MTEYFPFNLSPFQNEAIDAIKRGDHCLVTAHTGSGKTVPAEFAIQYFTSMNKRVIYTSPIKALSNQKLHDFREKYPHISFGIVTGDIEDNKEAQVLIMTTEILSNSLLNRTLKNSHTNEVENNSSIENPSSIRFDMDYENDLAAVVFDEVHYISDTTRGQAWEQSMMLLPKTVIYVMLSATIANPYTLINWIQNITEKQVCLASTSQRVVPLKHYVYTPNVPDKKLRSMTKEAQSQVNDVCNKITLIKEGEGPHFKQEFYSSIYNIHKRHLCEYEPSSTIPELIRKLKTIDMLPALIFVFSRKGTKVLAEKLCASGLPPLFNKDDTIWKDISGQIERECRHLLSKKIPNYEDFLEREELRHLLSCVNKGVAYHHAGMIPVLRELVEFLDTKGFIKVLFATETFAVGVNMPTRTVVFTSLNKYTEEGERLLMPHEYTQMAGRAGRRGLDTVGHCIILSPELSAPGSLATLLNGRPTSIKSNYHVSYQLVLGCLASSINQTMTYRELVDKATEYSHNSLSAPNHKDTINCLKYELSEAKMELEKVATQLSVVKTHIDVIEKYRSLNAKLASGMLNNKMKKTYSRDVCSLCKDNFYLERDYEIMRKHWKHETNVKEKLQEIKNAESYVTNEVRTAIYVLLYLKFIEYNSVTNNDNLNDYEIDTRLIKMCELGHYAMSVYEAHPLGLPLALSRKCNFYRNCILDDIKEEAINLSKFLSIFCEVKSEHSNYINDDAKNDVIMIEEAYNDAYDTEKEGCDSGRFYLSKSYEIQGVLYNYVCDWCYSETNEQCKKVIHSVNNDLNISTGDFVKSIMKIIKLSKELSSGAEITGNIVLVSICNEIPKLLLKYVVTSQSLYV